jgi:hypothetical protein
MTRMDETHKLLATFEAYLRRADEEGTALALEPVLDVIADQAQWAVVWRRALYAGAHGSEALRALLLPLLWSVPVLACGDTAQAAAEYLSTTYPSLAETERAQVELAILAVPDCETTGSRESRERRRDLLLGALPEASLVTDEVRRAVKELRSRERAPAHETRPTTSVAGADRSEIDTVAEQKALAGDEPSEQLVALCEPISSFVARYTVANPPRPEEVTALMPVLQSLYAALELASSHGTDQAHAYPAWNQLVQACEIIAGLPEADCTSERFALVREVLLDA